MSSALLTLYTREDRRLAHAMVDQLPHGAVVTFREPGKRSLEQNALMWKWLTKISQQAVWAGKKRTVSEWKDLFSASFKAAQGGLEAVPGLEGGFMILGLHTSELTVREMTELLDYIESWCAQHGVDLGEAG